MKYIHCCPHKLNTKAQTLEDQLLFMRGAIAQLQRHCDHLHKALEAAGIEVHEDLLEESEQPTDNLPTSLGAPNEPAPN